MNSYAIYVSDDAGWQRECPDSESVFFGYPSEGWEEYVHPVRGGIEPCGHVTVTGYRKAVALCAELNRSGDWCSHDPDKTEETRPSYAIRKL